MATGNSNITSEQMPKLNLESDLSKLRKTDLIFMKRIESLNLQRVKDLKQSQKRNRILGLGLTALALGIYGYTFYAIKQETFLDDFNEPETVIEVSESKNK